MLKIRFRRTGKKNNPNYRIVVAEHTSPVNGKFIDKVGHYNPHTKETVIDKELALAWINKGATPSNSVARLMVKEKISHPNIVIKVSAKRNPKKEVQNPEPQAKAPEEPTEVITPSDKQEEVAEIPTETVVTE